MTAAVTEATTSTTLHEEEPPVVLDDAHRSTVTADALAALAARYRKH